MTMPKFSLRESGILSTMSTISKSLYILLSPVRRIASLRRARVKSKALALQKRKSSNKKKGKNYEI